jgi:hypothetical protein
MVVLYDGQVVYEYGNIEEISYLASCRKSVLAMLYGKYVEDGWGGQYITVIPNRKLVIAQKAKLSTLTLWGLTPGGVDGW